MRRSMADPHLHCGGRLGVLALGRVDRKSNRLCRRAVVPTSAVVYARRSMQDSSIPCGTSSFPWLGMQRGGRARGGRRAVLPRSSRIHATKTPRTGVLDTPGTFAACQGSPTRGASHALTHHSRSQFRNRHSPLFSHRRFDRLHNPRDQLRGHVAGELHGGVLQDRDKFHFGLNCEVGDAPVE